MRLTVAIPTYNRPNEMRALLERLLPVLTRECELLIVDNHSEIPAEDSLRDLLAAWPNVYSRIVRNRFNIGGAGNILRCFELCETPWLWLLGDDDLPTENAISIIFKYLDEHPEACFINFVSPVFHRPTKQVTSGLDAFIHKLDSWSNLLFMSVGVYHCPTVVPQLRFGYQYMYSSAPHVAMLLASLAESGRCVMSPSCIISHQAPAGWAATIALLGKMSLLDLPMSVETRRTLARKLRAKPSLEVTTLILLHNARAHETSHDALYQYDQICGRSYYYDCSWLMKVKIAGYRWLVRFHRLAYPFMRAVYPALSKLVGKGHVKFSDLCSADLYQRI